MIAGTIAPSGDDWGNDEWPQEPYRAGARSGGLISPWLPLICALEPGTTNYALAQVGDSTLPV